MPTLDMIRKAVQQAALEYPVRRVELFGSCADGTATGDSDTISSWSSRKTRLRCCTSAAFVKPFPSS